MEEELVTQMGLLLTQMKGIGTSLDSIAQATARYAGFAFADAFSAGGRFGAPPLRDGALLVHVVNLRDLVASSGVAGFFEGLLGGIGRFFGGLIGGVVGGTIAGVTLPVMIWKVDSIVRSIQKIVDQLGIKLGADDATGKDGKAAAQAKPSTQFAAWNDLKDTLSLVTGLFEASAQGAPSGQRQQLLATPQMQQWQSMLQTVQGIVGGATQLVKGLMLLIPIAVGSLSLLIDKLDAIKLAFVDMLAFLVRNVMLLRGVILVTVFDLLGAVARLVAGLVGVIGTMVQGLMKALFDMAATVLEGALGVFQFLGGSLQRTVNGLVGWVVDTLFVVLARLGDLRVFRLLTHIIQVLPAVLPPIYELARDEKKSAPLGKDQLKALKDAAALAIPAPLVGSDKLPSSQLPKMPSVADLAMPKAELDKLRQQLAGVSAGLVSGIEALTREVQSGFARMAAKFDEMVQKEVDHSQGAYAERLDKVRANSEAFAKVFASAQEAAAKRPATGLEAIAKAYEEWLVGAGMSTMLARITEYFKSTAPSDTSSIPGAIVGGPVARPRASIEIDEVVIDLGPTEDATGFGAYDIQRLIEMLREYQFEQQLRGGPPQLLTA